MGFKKICGICKKVIDQDKECECRGGMKNIAVTRSNRKVPNYILELELRCI